MLASSSENPVIDAQAAAAPTRIAGRTPILVTGSHRSGSTWVGTVLAATPAVGYIHEPFNPENRFDICAAGIDTWFLYVDDRNADRYARELRDALAFRYPFGRKLAAARSVGSLQEVVVHFLRYGHYRLTGKRPLMKDPIAIFSAEWLARTYDMEVVTIIRHPAAFASSLVKAGWRHPFGHFLAQPALMAEHLRSFEPEIARYAEQEPPILDQAILLWRIIHHVIRTYRDRNPDWIFVRHEDLSRDADREFRALYSRLGLDYTDAVRDYVASHSDASNPAESRNLNDLRLDSRQNILSWKKRLGPAEIDRIRDETADVWPSFYSAEDWG